MTDAPLLTLRGVSKTYQEGRRTTPAVDNISLQATAGDFVTLVGPSGCGKSTLFNIIVGLLEADTGEICLHGEHVPHRLGRFAYMPQRDLLLPWRTVLDNVILGPEIAGDSLKAARQQARDLLPLFGLEGFASAHPAKLSGGMRQRAALLRTFLIDRDIMLLDEPFGALDAITRRELQSWLLDIRQQFDKTILFITHDVEEALYLSDRVLVMSPRPGRIILTQPIDLPRPRPPDIFTRDDFVSLKEDLLHRLQTNT